MSLYVDIIQLIVVIVATIYAIKQLKENTRIRQIEVMDNIFEYVSTPDARTARKIARDIRFPEDLTELSDTEREAIEFTLIRWARVGVLFEQKVLCSKDENVLFRAYSLSIVNSWERLQEYVNYVRDHTGMPDYFYHVEYLANLADDWREKRNLPKWV